MNFKYLGLGSLLGVVLFAVLGATVVDRITYFSSTSVSKTNYVSELAVTNGATLGGVRRTSWPSGGDTIWTNFAPKADIEGGVVVGAYETNAKTNGAISYSVNYLTNLWGSPGFVVNLGITPFDVMSVASSNVSVYGIGDYPFYNTHLSSCADVFVIGQGQMPNSTITGTDLYAIGEGSFDTFIGVSVDNIYSIGPFSINNSIFDHSSSMFAIGNGGLSHSAATNCESIIVIGGGLQGATLNDSRGVIAIGRDAGNGIIGAWTNIVLLGEGATLSPNAKDIIQTGPAMDLHVGQAITTGGDTNRWIFKGLSIEVLNRASVDHFDVIASTAVDLKQIVGLPKTAVDRHRNNCTCAICHDKRPCHRVASFCNIAISWI